MRDTNTTIKSKVKLTEREKMIFYFKFGPGRFKKVFTA
jgi:hypothetical protein